MVVLLQQKLPMVRFQVVPAGSYPLVVVLQVVIATAGQMADATAPESQRATARLVVMLWSRDERGIPPECDRFEPGQGQFHGDRGQRQQDRGLQQLLAGCQEAGTFRTGVSGYGCVDAVVRPAQIHREGFVDLSQVVRAATVGPIFDC